MCGHGSIPLGSPFYVFVLKAYTRLRETDKFLVDYDVGSDVMSFEHKSGCFDHLSEPVMPYLAFYMLSILNFNMLLDAFVICF